jgi:hypothetical protein
VDCLDEAAYLQIGHKIGAERRSCREDLFARSHEDRFDEPERGGFQRRAERGLIAWMGDRDSQPGSRLRGSKQALVLLVSAVMARDVLRRRTRHEALSQLGKLMLVSRAG